MSRFSFARSYSYACFQATKQTTRRPIVFILLGIVLFTGCKDVSNPAESNETEVLTTVQLLLTNQDDASDTPQATIQFKEGFGHGDALEKNDTLKLKAGATYTAELILLNESVNPAEVMSEEVEQEGVDHQLFYQSSNADLTVDYADKDENQLPIGLRIELKVGSAGMGTLRVTLKHQPDLKSATSTLSTGETDVDVSFHVTIE
jgi:hypothetical protein